MDRIDVGFHVVETSDTVVALWFVRPSGVGALVTYTSTAKKRLYNLIVF